MTSWIRQLVKVCILLLTRDDTSVYLSNKEFTPPAETCLLHFNNIWSFIFFIFNLLSKYFLWKYCSFRVFYQFPFHHRNWYPNSQHVKTITKISNIYLLLQKIFFSIHPDPLPLFKVLTPPHSCPTPLFWNSHSTPSHPMKKIFHTILTPPEFSTKWNALTWTVEKIYAYFLLWNGRCERLIWNRMQPLLLSGISCCRLYNHSNTFIRYWWKRTFHLTVKILE